MKKRFFAVLLALCLILCMAVPAMAASEWHVQDTADLLTQQDAQQLEQQAAEISDAYGCGVYLITVPDMAEWDYDDAYDFAKALYSDNDLGEGEDANGILLLLSMENRDYALIAHGQIGNAAFTDYGKEQMENDFLDCFKNDDWEGGFEAYLDDCETYLDAYVNQGEAVDSPAASMSLGERFCAHLLTNALLSAVIAGIWVLIARSRMKSVHKATQAAEYRVPGSAKLTLSTDWYTHSTVVRTPIHSDNGHSGGTTVDSGGFSGHSGKF